MSEQEPTRTIKLIRPPRPPLLGNHNAVADFDCLSGKCDKRGMIVSYELPISARRCPVCGSKKIKRRYDTQRIAIRTGPPARPDDDPRHTSSSVAARTDALAEPAMLQADASAARWKEARLKYPGAHMVPAKNLKTAIGGLLQGLGAQGSVPVTTDASDTDKARKGTELPGVIEEMAEITQGRVPTKLEARDREFKVVRGGDGTVGLEKA